MKTIADRGHFDLHIFANGLTVEGTSNGGPGLAVMIGEAIIHRWHAATCVQSSSFQAEETELEKAISWLEHNEDRKKALLICDCKSLVAAVGNSHAPDEGIRLVQAAVARLNAESCHEVLWVPGIVA